MIGDRPRVGVGEAGEREERLRDLLELRRLRAGLHSPALSAFTRHRLRRALRARATVLGARLFVAAGKPRIY